MGTQFEELAPTATSDRMCLQLTVCDPNTEYESEAATRTSDRVCAPLTECDFNSEFESVARTPTSDRTCIPLTTCEYATHFRSVDKTQTSDRTCSLLRECVMGQEYETRAPTHTTDRTCTSITVCGAGQKIISEPTATTDRQCLTICPAGHRQTKVRVSNIENTECELCPDGQFTPLPSNSPTCQICARGHKAADDRKSCFQWSCSHIHCRLETHKCANKVSKHATCNGSSTHTSIRVFHGGCSHAPAFDFKCQETVCTNGHHCGMGFLTGDTSKCECRPTLPRHHFLPVKRLRTAV